jgi:hypothetical protein
MPESFLRLRTPPADSVGEEKVPDTFFLKAEQEEIDLSELLTDVLKRDIEINEALK